MTDLKELEEHFRNLRACCLHDPQWTPVEAAEVLFAVQRDPYGGDQWENGYHGGSDTSVVVGVRLRDGSYGLLSSSEDYTGHGCRCGSYTGRYVDFKDLVKNGLLPEL